ncbi:MAG TPA: 16S rRNA (guanine(966)-N(2))-methyltransferase RsmD [Patescibacteria group bacterium]|nr:16S rRNA (guanine(966)-N(2))-methyltransferase RsmD [Patescibacteria group bacterium]
MRIITGSAKGCKLYAPRGLDVRPTSDRVKESVFNILGTRVFDAQVLDLFAGTGNLSLEALSRGAAAALLVEESPVSVAAIERNLAHTRLASLACIWRMDVFKALNRLTREDRKFQLAFADPPYNKGYAARILSWFDEVGPLEDGGILVIEHSGHEPLENSLCRKQMEIKRVERYGETVITFAMAAIRGNQEDSSI